MYFEPGSYLILNHVKFKVYVGQGVRISVRIGGHIARLETGKHPCVAMQEDWNRLGAQVFSVHMVNYGSAFATKRVREL